MSRLSLYPSMAPNIVLGIKKPCAPFQRQACSAMASGKYSYCNILFPSSKQQSNCQWYFEDGACIPVIHSFQIPTHIPPSQRFGYDGVSCCEAARSKFCDQKKHTALSCVHIPHPDGKGFTTECRQ